MDWVTGKREKPKLRFWIRPSAAATQSEQQERLKKRADDIVAAIEETW
jgi:hypothetical protein